MTEGARPGLCQRPSASCGACCGLYNREDLSREAVRKDLRRSTALLTRTPRTAEAFRAAAGTRARALPAPLFPSVRICPLLGFLDAEETRVGCLAHPRATGGPDLRACGTYDVLTCEAFLCPSHARLSEEDAAVAAVAAGDFYLYGLVVTDAPFLREVLLALEERTGARPNARDLAHGPLRETLRALLAMKEELAPGSEGHFGAFRPGQAAAERQGESGRAERVAALLGGDARSGNDDEALAAELLRRLDACAGALREARRRLPRRAAHGARSAGG